MQFASAVAEIVEEMKTTSLGLPEVPQQAFWPTALEVFKMRWENTDVFEFADVGALYKYLRKSKKLRIPDEWIDYVPWTLDNL